MTTGSLMKVKSIAECSHVEHSAMLFTCIMQLLVLKIIFCLFESGCFTQVLLYNSFANALQQEIMVTENGRIKN